VFVVIKSAVAVVLRVPSYVWIYAVIFLYFFKVVISPRPPSITKFSRKMTNGLQ